jgi:LuxR family quorum-sensing system transcriptional regulator CciR
MIGAEAVPAEKILLTPRERSVLQWAMGNKSAWSTGQILAISENTVKFHMKNAMRKLGATSRHQAILMAINLGLI